MVNRFWDSEGKYEKYFIKEFGHWTLEISCKQHTLGALILFSKHPVQRLSELKEGAVRELIELMKKAEVALSQVFQPDRFNYLQLGNSLHHLHIHCVPRYQNPRNFTGLEWIDANFGKPVTWLDQETVESTVLKIKEVLEEHLQ